MAAIPYKYKLTAFIQVFVLAGLVILSTVVYQRLTGLIEKEMGMRAQGIAVAASYLINSNIKEYMELEAPEDAEKAFYQEMTAVFGEFMETNQLKYVFTEKRISDDQIMYILDAEIVDGQVESEIGAEDDMNVLREKAYQTHQPVYGPLTDDPVWGKFITGYAPLIDRETGTFIGLIGVDIEADEVYKLFDDIKIVIVITSAAIFVISLFITYKFADMMVRPMFIDGLTKAFNHKYFQETLLTEINKASKQGNPISLLMMDLDLFKLVNDTYGHRFGDYVLMSTALVMNQNIRKGDVLARYGGEEFAVILPGTGITEAFQMASVIREKVADQELLCQEADQKINITISIGVAEWEPGITRDELINRADRAMYFSKNKARNLVTAYHDGLPQIPGICNRV